MGATANELNEFIDGSSYVGGDQSGGDRYELGMEYAKEHYEELISGMKEGETFKFVSHSEGGAFAAGMAAYLMSKGKSVESMLYLSPDEADEFSTPLGTFSMQSHFENDPVSPSMRLDGVDVYMKFSVLENGEKIEKTEAHGATVSSRNIEKIKTAVGTLNSGLRDLIKTGKWTIYETKDGFTFDRLEEEKKKEEKTASDEKK